MKKKKSIKDIVSYSEIKKGQLVGGIFLGSLGMLLSICPILVIYKVIKSLFLYGISTLKEYRWKGYANFILNETEKILKKFKLFFS